MSLCNYQFYSTIVPQITPFDEMGYSSNYSLTVIGVISI